MVGCCKLSLYANESCDGAYGFFWAMIEMTRQVHHVFALWQGCNFSRIEALNFRVFEHAYSINSLTNTCSRIRYKKQIV